MTSMLHKRLPSCRLSELNSWIIDDNPERAEECKKRPIDKATIEACCMNWARAHLGLDFKFREHQLEHIVEMLHCILSKKHKMNVIEAPTGSGKSIIGMVIAGTAWEYYRKTSYILVSDLGLMDQYIDDFDKYKFDWGYIRGMKNYHCAVDGMMFQNAMCRVRRCSYLTLMDPSKAAAKGFSCAEYCEIIRHRIASMTSPVALMTYQLYLCYMNDVRPRYNDPNVRAKEGPAPFDLRDIVIADECHKIPGIVQDWCSPSFTSYDIEHFKILIDFAYENGFMNKDGISHKDFRELMNRMWDNTSKWDILNAFKDYYNRAEEVQKAGMKIMDHYAKKETLDKHDYKVIAAQSWLENHMSHIDEYEALISAESLVKTGESRDSFQLKCVYEDALVDRFFNRQCNAQVLMSATIGDAMMFHHEIGGNHLTNPLEYHLWRIPTTFDYTKSPIYVLGKYKMSFNEKENNFAPQAKLIEEICNHHLSEKGIIHTGSYEFSKKLLELSGPSLRERLLCYTTSKDKKDLLDEYLYSKNKILAGPSLIEGVNLPDDLCRFMIVMKVPYASLGDQLVKAKMRMIQGWYKADTLKKIIQSLGRGVRSKTDWCITYILDGCFCDLYLQSKSNLNPELVERIKFVEE